MTSKINISIPEPCHENWQKMTAVEKGKFCGACQKNVYDFTKSSDREIISAYNKESNLCGRFLNNQLNRDLIVIEPKKSIWVASTSIILSFLSLGNQETQAQEKPQVEKSSENVLGGISGVIKPIDFEKKGLKITGFVSDATGVLPGVNIIVKGTTRGVSTDFGGNYNIEANKGEVLVFSFIGMKDEEITISKNPILNVTLKEDEFTFVGFVVKSLGDVEMKKKPTFFGRIFRKIGRVFK